MFTDTPGAHQIQFVRQSRHYSAVKSAQKSGSDGGGGGASSASASAAANVDADAHVQPCFHFYGTGLTMSHVKEWLLKCLTPPVEPLPLRTRPSMTKGELEAVVKEHASEALPDGIFFNGRQYVTTLSPPPKILTLYPLPVFC